MIIFLLLIKDLETQKGMNEIYLAAVGKGK